MDLEWISLMGSFLTGGPLMRCPPTGRSLMNQSHSPGTAPDEMRLWRPAALSVAAALRRMRTHPQQDGAKGLILLEATELTRWARTIRRYAPSPPPNTHTTPPTRHRTVPPTPPTLMLSMH